MLGISEDGRLPKLKGSPHVYYGQERGTQCLLSLVQLVQETHQMTYNVCDCPSSLDCSKG